MSAYRGSFVTALGVHNVLSCNPSGRQISNRDTGMTRQPDLTNTKNLNEQKWHGWIGMKSEEKF